MTILAFTGAVAFIAAVAVPVALAVRLRAEALRPTLRPVTVRARRRPR